MKKDIFKKATVGIALGFALLPFLTWAIGPLQENELITTPYQITVMLGKILTWIGSIVFIIAIIMLLYAAILFLFGGASADAQTKAKTVLTYAIIGIVVALLAYSIVPFIRHILGWGGPTT